MTKSYFSSFAINSPATNLMLSGGSLHSGAHQQVDGKSLCQIILALFTAEEAGRWKKSPNILRFFWKLTTFWMQCEVFILCLCSWTWKCWEMFVGTQEGCAEDINSSRPRTDRLVVKEFLKSTDTLRTADRQGSTRSHRCLKIHLSSSSGVSDFPFFRQFTSLVFSHVPQRGLCFLEENGLLAQFRMLHNAYDRHNLLRKRSEKCTVLFTKAVGVASGAVYAWLFHAPPDFILGNTATARANVGAKQ